MNKLSTFFPDKLSFIDFLSKRLSIKIKKHKESSILDDYALFITPLYNQTNSSRSYFCISHFLYFETWNTKDIYLFFFNRSHFFFLNTYTNINLINNFDKRTIFNIFTTKSSLSRININFKFNINKIEILTIISKFSKKFNFDETALIHLYSRISSSSFFVKNDFSPSSENCFLLLKNIFIEYKKLKNYYSNHCFINADIFFSSSVIIINYDSSIFLNSSNWLTKNVNKLSVKFPFLLHFLRVQRRYNKRRYAKSRLYSRPSFFAGVCLSSVVISSFWGGTIKSVDWLSVLPVVVNINYILYTLLFLAFFKFFQLSLNIIFLNSSNKFKIYYFLNILFFKSLFRKII